MISAVATKPKLVLPPVATKPKPLPPEPQLLEWNDEYLVEIELPKKSSYEKVKEILTRIGVSAKDDKTLYQSCHILKMEDKLWLVHFKELFALRGVPTTFNSEDLRRRQSIIGLLTQWELILPVNDRTEYHNKIDVRGITVISKENKINFMLESKFNLIQH